MLGVERRWVGELAGVRGRLERTSSESDVPGVCRYTIPSGRAWLYVWGAKKSVMLLCLVDNATKETLDMAAFQQSFLVGQRAADGIVQHGVVEYRLGIACMPAGMVTLSAD